MNKYKNNPNVNVTQKTTSKTQKRKGNSKYALLTHAISGVLLCKKG